MGTHEPNAPTERENKLAEDEALFCTYIVIWHQEKEKSWDAMKPLRTAKFTCFSFFHLASQEQSPLLRVPAYCGLSHSSSHNHSTTNPKGLTHQLAGQYHHHHPFSSLAPAKSSPVSIRSCKATTSAAIRDILLYSIKKQSWCWAQCKAPAALTGLN